METGRAKAALQKIAGIATTSKSITVPQWVIWVSVILQVIYLGYGVVQQCRIWRWEKILWASKECIISLEAEQAKARYQGIRQATSRAVAGLEKRVGDVDAELQRIQKKREESKGKIQGMTPAQLKEAFRREGF